MVSDDSMSERVRGADGANNNSSSQSSLPKPDISVVMPAFNEVETIPIVEKRIWELLDIIDFTVQFVFVDDGSKDETFQRLCDIDIPGVSIKVVKLSRNFGAHAAWRAGVFYADSDYCVLYAIDMPEPLSDVKLFYEGLREGYGIVYSTRVGYKMPLASRINAKMVDRFVEGGYPSDGLFGIAFHKPIKDELNRNIENNSSITFQIFQMGFSRKAMPVEFQEREEGSSKWTLRKKLKLFVDTFVMFSYMPIHFIEGLGFVTAFVGFAWALFILVAKVLNLLQFSAGWPTLASLLLIGFGLTNISLGVVAEYLARTLDAVRNRPTFIASDVVVKDASANE